MKIQVSQSKRKWSAFSMIDVVVSMGVIGVTVVSLYAGISLGFAMTEAAREQLRATQIIMEKFETIRLYTWDQLNEPNFIPTSFSTPYAFNNTNSTFYFNGQVTITNPPGNNTYGGDMKMVIVRVSWTAGGLQNGLTRSREMSTLVSRFGLQHYVY